MSEIVIQKEDKLLQIINKITNSESSELKIVISEDSILFKNILNLKIIQKVLDSSKKIAKFETQSELGKSMLLKLRESLNDEADFTKYEDKIREKELEFSNLEEENPKTKFEMPKFSIPKVNFGNLKLIPVFIGGFALVFGVFYYFFVYNLSANVEIIVSSERFVKSFDIKVSSLKNTDVDQKILRGESISTVFQAKKELPTTGKVEGGKKAEGEIKFLNKTDKVIKLSKNTKLTYKESGKEYIFLLDDSIEIPTRKLTSTAPETFVSGEEVGFATAENFGSSYNVPAGKNLSISGYPTSDLSGVVSSSFEGGVKNTLNAISEEDLRKVSSESFSDFKSSFVFNTTPSQQYLKNSEFFSIASQKFNGDLSTASDKISVTQDINVSYLVYDYNQALAFVKSSIKSLIPDGYELYGKDLTIELNSLGSTESSPNRGKETDAVITLKSYKIPVIDENEVKSNLSGKTISEVSKYLEDLNVNFNIESSSGLLNLLGFPKDPSKINVTITRE